jgi:hypothetical protein
MKNVITYNGNLFLHAQSIEQKWMYIHKHCEQRGSGLANTFLMAERGLETKGKEMWISTLEISYNLTSDYYLHTVLL